MNNYTIAIRKPKGAWQNRQYGSTARETKRNLAKIAGLPIRLVDPIPVGRKTNISFSGEEYQIKLDRR